MSLKKYEKRMNTRKYEFYFNIEKINLLAQKQAK